MEGITKGKIYRVSGPLVIAESMRGSKVYEVVEVGNERLIGEIIGVEEDKAIIQVYEDTNGLKVGDPVYGTGYPLAAELGPGLVGSIYDGIQRPLPILQELAGFFVRKGVKASPLPRDKKWHFIPLIKKGEKVSAGDIIGYVNETETVKHYIMVPPDIHGHIDEIAGEGDYSVEDTVAVINGREINMVQKWPVRKPRPYKEKIEPREPLITGQRVIDFLFPLAKGGKAAIPGGFGTGKCVPPGTPILLGDGTIKNIDEIFEEIKGSKPDPEKIEEIIRVEGKDIYVYAFDGKRFKKARITHVYRGYTDKLVRIKTSSGRIVEVTPAHKLPVRRRGDHIEFVPASSIKAGDYLVVPRLLPLGDNLEQAIEPANHKHSEIATTMGSEKQKFSQTIIPELAELIGLILSGGLIADNKLIFCNDRSEVLEEFKRLINTLFKTETILLRNDEENCIVIDSPRRIVEYLGHIYTSKHVPTYILNSSRKIAAEFLKGYYTVKGSFEAGKIEITCVSREIMRDIAYLLTKLGILYSVDYEENKIVIMDPSEVERFYHIVLREALQSRKTNMFAEYVSTNTGAKNPEKLSYNTGIFPGHDNVENEENKQTLIASSSSTQQILVINRFAAEAQLTRYIVLDRIVEVKEVPVKTMVYDVTVENYHNFVGGHVPVIYHNTVTLQQLTKWSAVDIAIYVGCGERGNEMADALHSFRKLIDPRTGKPLVGRSVFIANTSNMPVAARETSIFLGATIGEYFRDMGYNVLMVADSTSRWAEAMREISGRLEELPGEEGYPAYLGSRLASFYERSGHVKTLGQPERSGSLTIMGAVSPPGADFSEPVTQSTLRIVRALYALDVNLAYRRHYPAINWLISYSLYVDNVTDWWHKNIDPSWRELREKALTILQKESELEELVRLVGAEALPEEDKLLLEVARMIREDFLQQNAFHEIDTYCPPKKALLMMKAILLFYDLGLEAIRKGVTMDKIRGLKSRVKIARMKEIPNVGFESSFESLFEDIRRDFEALTKEEEVIEKL